MTSNPAKDPELLSLVAFQGCQTVVCLPLRASYQIYGAIVLGTEEVFDFEERDLELLTSIAEQAVVALAARPTVPGSERTRRSKIIETEEAARTALARSLHDGPTQNVATIAMRIALIRSILPKNPGTSCSGARESRGIGQAIVAGAARHVIYASTDGIGKARVGRGHRDGREQGSARAMALTPTGRQWTMATC